MRHYQTYIHTLHYSHICFFLFFFWEEHCEQTGFPSKGYRNVKGYAMEWGHCWWCDGWTMEWILNTFIKGMVSRTFLTSWWFSLLGYWVDNLTYKLRELLRMVVNWGKNWAFVVYLLVSLGRKMYLLFIVRNLFSYTLFNSLNIFRFVQNVFVREFSLTVT